MFSPMLDEVLVLPMSQPRGRVSKAKPVEIENTIVVQKRDSKATTATKQDDGEDIANDDDGDKNATKDDGAISIQTL